MIIILTMLQIVLMITMIYLLISNNKNSKSRKIVIDKENKKEMKRLKDMRSRSLNIPLTEKSRPTQFSEVIGQENGILALKAALCGPNPQHVIIYGPPGVGKTAAVRLILEEAKKNPESPFALDAKCVEIDATTLRFDERGIADPLIGSVHDPIYQGAGALGIAGIPQPREGAVTKAHGGILFIDEIGELHPIQINKLLKVLEDRKVFLESSYYSAEDPNMPNYIKEIFENGLPADFRLVGATTRSPEDIPPAIRSRCIEIYFKQLDSEEIVEIGKESAKKIGVTIEKEAEEYLGEYCHNGREVVSLVQLSYGLASNEGRKIIKPTDIQWVIDNCEYSRRLENNISEKPQIGVVNGLAVIGANVGMIMQVEVAAKYNNKKDGTVKISGIVEEESINSQNRKLKRKSTAISSVENVITVLNNLYNLQCLNYDIHINIPGGMPVDGPSAGIAIACAVYSSIKQIPISNKIAITGEIGILGSVKPVGGIKAKVLAAKKSGASKVIIPKGNYSEIVQEISGIDICAVEEIQEVFDIVFDSNEDSSKDLLYAHSNNIII